MLTPVWRGRGVVKGTASNLTLHPQHEARTWRPLTAAGWLYWDEFTVLSCYVPEVLNPVRTTEPNDEPRNHENRVSLK